MKRACRAVTRSGGRSQAPARSGGTTCYLHKDRSRAAELGRRGGSARRSWEAYREDLPPLQTVDDIRKFLSGIAKDLCAGRLESLFHSGDRVIFRYTHYYDRIRRPFDIQGKVSVLPGTYTWDSAQFRFLTSPNRKGSGESSFRHQPGFYGGISDRFGVGFQSGLHVTSVFDPVGRTVLTLSFGTATSGTTTTPPPTTER